MMLGELRKIIPSFLTRVDLVDRGVKSSEYLEDVRARLDGLADGLGSPNDEGTSVTLTDWDPDAEPKGKGLPTWAASLPSQTPVTWTWPALSLSVLLSDQSPSAMAAAPACSILSAS
jgi:hypothetical protein